MSAQLEASVFDSWHSYPSIFALGHRALADLFADPVTVEEKVDGSQFSFGRFNGELRCRSKGAQLNIVAPEKMFVRAVEAAEGLDLHDGWTYRAEYLQKPKHNCLLYERVPAKHLIVFDINVGNEDYLSWERKSEEAARLGLEVVPRIAEQAFHDVSSFREMLDRVSVLGGQKIEGVVVKNYRRFGPDKKVLMGKFVSEAFKEVHAAEWKAENPKGGDVVQALIRQYKTPARWAKAVQHLREAGKITDTPRDIGLLIKEAQDDLMREEEQAIKDRLYQWARPQIARAAVGGIAEWYKDELLKAQFAGGVA